MREHGGQVLAGSKSAGNSGFETRTRSESPTKANSPAGSFVQEPTRMHPSISGGWCWVTEVREQETVQLPLPARGSNPGSLGCDPGALPLRNRLPERTNWSPSSKGSGPGQPSPVTRDRETFGAEPPPKTNTRAGKEIHGPLLVACYQFKAINAQIQFW